MKCHLTYTCLDYLEIPQRAKILNDRLKVVSDLLSMLRDHLTNFGVEYQTLIIIYLIIVAVIVACVSTFMGGVVHNDSSMCLVRDWRQSITIPSSSVVVDVSCTYHRKLLLLTSKYTPLPISSSCYR